MDIRPLNPGHTLIIPKKHARWVWDVKNFGDYLEFTKKVAKALQKAMNTKWVVMGVAGNEVAHAHIHLLPRFKGDEHGGFMKFEKSREIAKEKMEQFQKEISKAIKELA